MEDQVARRRMLREASAGIDALNAWVEHTLVRADDVDDEAEADHMRTCATRLWEVLNGAPTAVIASELHESMVPSFGALLDPVPA